MHHVLSEPMPLSQVILKHLGPCMQSCFGPIQKTENILEMFTYAKTTVPLKMYKVSSNGLKHLPYGKKNFKGSNTNPIAG